ncbi:hypothetical protein BH11PSE11_BH11PSE11_29760 [soil metagenome]
MMPNSAMTFTGDSKRPSRNGFAVPAFLFPGSKRGAMRMALKRGVAALILAGAAAGQLAYAQVSSQVQGAASKNPQAAALPPKSSLQAAPQASQFTTSATTAAEKKSQVLVLSPFGPGWPGVDLYIMTLMSTLRSTGMNGEDIFIEYLDLPRNPGQDYRDFQRALLAKKYGNRKIDLIVTVLQPGLNFVLNEGRQLAPSAPVLAALAQLEPGVDGGNRRLLLQSQNVDFKNTLKQAIDIFPATRQIVVVAGAGEVDRKYISAFKQAAVPWQDKLSFTFTEDLTFEEILSKVSNLPAHTIILNPGIWQDKTGRNVIPAEFAEKMTKATNVPVFVMYDTAVGTGAMGGSIFSVKNEAVRAASVAFEILNGTFTLSEAVTHLDASPIPMYDWQQLERWRVNPAKLPVDSIFVNRPPTLWGQYRAAVLTAGGFFFLLSLMIAVLIWQVRRKTLAEEALIASQDRYRALVEEAPEAIIVYDADLNKIIDVNSKAVRLFGRSREELYKLPLGDLYARMQADNPEMEKSIGDHIRRALDGESLVFERMVKPLNGKETPCEVWLARLSSREGKLLRASFIDIADRKNAEAELKKHRDHLEEQVVERTVALSVALNEAQAANRAKSNFLSHMSHEIRTPMNAILGYTQLMQRMPELTGTLKSHTAVIARSSDHLLALINDVLEMSKIESGSASLQMENINIRALTKDVDSMLRMRATEKALDLSFSIDDSVAEFIHTDGTKLRQILVNIIGNAIKFTDHGRITIRALMQDNDANSICVLFEIADTGPGIAEHEKPKVFDAFEQTESGHRKGGTGLGMAISRQYARMLGGDLTFESEVGKGTTVYFSFTTRPADAIAIEPLPAARTRITGLAPGSAQPKILIVDDVASNRDILRLMLHAVGLDMLQEAAEGEAVMALVKEWQPDIVLMDRRMPGLDGLQLTRLIKQLPAAANMRIIMVTASAFDEDRKTAFDAGADGFVSKPFSEQEILMEIQRVCPQLRFAFEEIGPAFPSAKSGVSDTNRAAAVAGLDRAVVASLVAMIECGDVESFEKCIALQVRGTSPALHDYLLASAHRFDYARILATLMPASDNAAAGAT